MYRFYHNFDVNKIIYWTIDPKNGISVGALYYLAPEPFNSNELLPIRRLISPSSCRHSVSMNREILHLYHNTHSPILILIDASRLRSNELRTFVIPPLKPSVYYD